MRAVVTGGAGFLGSHVADRLLDRGDEVWVIDNFATGRRDNLAPRAGLTVVEGSIADPALVAAVFDGARPECVIHAAAAYADPEDWVEDARTNVAGTVNVVRDAPRHGAARLVYLQTALCYGPARQQPIPLAHPLAPASSYAVSKTAGEAYVAMSGLPWISLRLANVYGPRHLSGPMPTFYRRLRRGERCTVVQARRDFVEVDDLLDLIDRVLEKPEAVGCFNVPSGREWWIRDVFEAMARVMGLSGRASCDVVPPGEDDVASLLLDPGETERVFGWRARVPLDRGLARLVAWYDAHGVEATYTHLAIGGRW